MGMRRCRTFLYGDLRAQHLSSDFNFAQQTRMRWPGPIGNGFPVAIAPRKAKHEGSSGLRISLLLQCEQDRGSVLHGTAKAKPRSKWYAAGDRRRNIAEVQNHNAEATTLQQQIGGFERLFDVGAGI